jgi:hypothetical protein
MDAGDNRQNLPTLRNFVRYELSGMSTGVVFYLGLLPLDLSTIPDK